MRETRVESNLITRIEKLGGKCWKFVSPGNRGVPDRLVLLPGGRAVFIELKAPKKKASLQQLKRISELKALGFEVEVLDTVEKINAYARKLTEKIERDA